MSYLLLISIHLFMKHLLRTVYLHVPDTGLAEGSEKLRPVPAVQAHDASQAVLWACTFVHVLSSNPTTPVSGHRSKVMDSY